MNNNPNIAEWFRKGVTDKFTGSKSVLDGSDVAYEMYNFGAKLAAEGKINRGPALTTMEIYGIIADYDLRKHYLKSTPNIKI